MTLTSRRSDETRDPDAASDAMPAAVTALTAALALALAAVSATLMVMLPSTMSIGGPSHDTRSIMEPFAD